MTITEIDRVDFVVTGGGEIVLVISDHLDWIDIDAHLGALAAKVQTYIDFVDGGQIAEHKKANDSVMIRVACKYMPPVDGTPDPSRNDVLHRAAA